MAKRYSVELISNYTENVVLEFHGITSPQTTGLQADLGDKNERFVSARFISGLRVFTLYFHVFCRATFP